jgi:hypothetical protein
MTIFDIWGVTRWNTQFFIHTWTFSFHHLCCFIVIPLFVLDKSMTWNKCLQHPCYKTLCKIAQASQNSDSNTQHFLSDLLTHSWFHSMLFALLSYHFPYTLTNRYLYWVTYPGGSPRTFRKLRDMKYKVHFKLRAIICKTCTCNKAQVIW